MQLCAIIIMFQAEYENTTANISTNDYSKLYKIKQIKTQTE